MILTKKNDLKHLQSDKEFPIFTQRALHRKHNQHTSGYYHSLGYVYQ